MSVSRVFVVQAPFDPMGSSTKESRIRVSLKYVDQRSKDDQYDSLSYVDTNSGKN